MTSRRLAQFGAAHLVLTVIVGVMWLWSWAWQQGALEEMSDQLVHDTQADAVLVAKERGSYVSTGAFLQQGWGGRVLVCGVALIAISAVGGVAMIVAGSRRSRPV